MKESAAGVLVGMVRLWRGFWNSEGCGLKETRLWYGRDGDGVLV